MASNSTFKVLALLSLSLTICIRAAFGEVTCEHLNQDVCAFAVSSTGKRCVLEKHVRRSGPESYTCGASEIEAEKIRNWVETDECIKVCGLDRKSFGISSDSLLDSRFTEKLCSPKCYNGCPNVLDLYSNLAAGEGVFLPKLCESKGGDVRRGMAEIQSSGYFAPGPGQAEEMAEAPAPC